MGVYGPYFNAVSGIKKPKRNKKSIHIAIYFLRFAKVKGSHSNIFPHFQQYEY
jgi:hypothetical protein